MLAVSKLASPAAAIVLAVHRGLVQSRANTRVVGTQCLFGNREAVLLDRIGVAVAAFSFERECQPRYRGCMLHMIGPVLLPRTIHVASRGQNCISIFAVATELIHFGAEISQIV